MFVPLHEHLHDMLAVIRTAHPIIIRMGEPGCDIFYWHRDITLGDNFATIIVSDHFRTRRCFEHHFRLTVPVKIVNEELRIVRTCANIHPKVDPVEQPPV
ncbi:hypothetical protein D3C84_1044910 [compost metagenome]